jgi:hypothetical protein
MSNFNQGAPGVATLINSSAVILSGNVASANALTVRQFGTGNVFSAQTTTGSTALFVNAAGNVGVGTTSPTTALDVFTGTMNAATVVATTHYGAIAGSNAIAASTLSLATALPVTSGGTGAATAQSAINALAGAVTSAQYLRGNGTNVVMSAISAGDVPTLNQNTTGSAGSLSTSYTAGRILYGANSGVPTTVSTLFYDSANGRVGVGTASPGYTLDVGSYGVDGGTIRIASSSSCAFRMMEANDTYGFSFTNVAASRMSIKRHSASQAGTEIISIMRDNSYVGIGTSTNLACPFTIYNPASTSTYTGTTAWGNLHLMPNGAENSWAGITFGGSSAGTIQQSTQASITVDSNSSTGTNMRFNVGYLFASGALERMTILGATGNVGIGTTSPTATFTVYNGDIKVQSSYGTPTYAFGGGLRSFVNAGVNSGVAICYADGTTNGALQPFVYVCDSLRVGIGTSTPGYPLHVNGAVSSPSVSIVYFNGGEGTTLKTYTGAITTSIYASNGILAGGSICSISDRRSKIPEEPLSDPYLSFVDKINVHQFSWVDKVEKDSGKKIGFFAQEVKDVLPDAVGRTTGVVPTIYRQAEAFTETTVTVTGHCLTTEKKLEIVDLENGKTKIDIVRVIDADILEVKFEKVPKDKIFVIGPEVDDLHVVNHDYLMAVGFGGLKELHALVKSQQTTIEMLTERLAALESKLAA